MPANASQYLRSLKCSDRETWVIRSARHAQVLTSELFGLQHFASNHALMHLAPTIGGLLFSATLAGNLYSVKGRAHNDPPGSCFGGDCYRRVACSLQLCLRHSRACL